MPTCRDIVSRAFQQAGIVAIGRSPSAAEADYAMEALQSLYDQWIEGGMFGRLSDVYTTVNYTAKEGERVIAPTAITVTLPTTLDDDYDPRAPYALTAIVTILNGTQTNYMRVKGAWVSVSGLTLDSEAPLAHIDRHGLSAVLGMVLTEAFGVQPGPVLNRMAANFTRALSFKFGSSQPPRQAEYF